MSTAAQRHYVLPPRRSAGAHPHALLRPFIIGTITLAATTLAIGIVGDGASIIANADELLLWAAVAAAIGLAAVTFVSGSELGLDAPLLLAAAMIFGPIPAGIIACVGYVDRREFRREVSIERALFNRAQIALSVMAGGGVFAAVDGLDATVPRFLAAALLAVAVDMIVNWALVVVVRVLHEGVTIPEAVSGSHTGRLPDFLLGYISFGLLGAALTQAYASAGMWTLATFGLVAVLGRSTFEASKSLSIAQDAIRQKDAQLLRINKRVAEERRDERLAVAAGLHDEVLPPLFKVHLLGQVVRQDLATGRLLDLETDVPDLVRATEAASDSMRKLIGSLRSSPIGARGLRGTLELLAAQLSEEAMIPIRCEVEGRDAPAAIQLLAYQVAREALRNAVRHAQAQSVELTVTTTDDAMRVVIADDGVGFVQSLVDRDAHFGLQLVRDRVELFGGTMVVDSSPGAGTRVVMRIPLDAGRN